MGGECTSHISLIGPRGRVAIAAVLASAGPYAANAAVITYTFGNPNANTGNLSIGYPLSFPAGGGVVAGFPVDAKGALITTMIAAATGETVASKQTKIVNYVKANLPAAFMVATPAANQVEITVPKATVAMLGAGEVPGIAINATGGIDAQGIVRGKIQANGDPPIGLIEFTGVFSATDQAGATSAFDAEIISTSGVSYDDPLAPSAFSALNGFSIAQRFYSDLLPVAASLGVSLSFYSAAPDDGQIVVDYLSAPVGSDFGVGIGSTSATGTTIEAVAEVPEPKTLAGLGIWAIMLAAARGFRRRVV